MPVAEKMNKWVWILTCRRCSRVEDFDTLHDPTRRIPEWATCCGALMELESVLRKVTEDA
jgi:hypothetical protein